MGKNSVKYISITKKEVVVVDKNIKMSILCQIYGKLLTEKQYQVLDDYYNNDLSLSEIAENLNAVSNKTTRLDEEKAKLEEEKQKQQEEQKKKEEFGIINKS